MARSATRLERLYDRHAAAAVRAGMMVLLRERRVLAASALMWGGRGSVWWCRGDELRSAGELLGARVTAFGEQAVVPDAMEALGQHVHEEPANELARLESHGCVALGAFEAVILVLERDAIRVEHE